MESRRKAEEDKGGEVNSRSGSYGSCRVRVDELSTFQWVKTWFLVVPNFTKSKANFRYVTKKVTI